MCVDDNKNDHEKCHANADIVNVSLTYSLVDRYVKICISMQH